MGVITLVAGYIALSRGPEDNPVSLSVAPVLLIAAYCVILPLGIILKEENDNSEKKGD